MFVLYGSAINIINNLIKIKVIMDNFIRVMCLSSWVIAILFISFRIYSNSKYFKHKKK